MSRKEKCRRNTLSLCGNMAEEERGLRMWRAKEIVNLAEQRKLLQGVQSSGISQ
jgi:hypothetical protein